MELAFARPSKERQISFAEIAQVAKINVDEVSAISTFQVSLKIENFLAFRSNYW